MRVAAFVGLLAWLMPAIGPVGCGAGGSGAEGFGTGVLEEAGNLSGSTDPDWWLSSGALFFRDGDQGRTIRGSLPPGAPWRQRYARSNPRDTDAGARPQNVFRLFRRVQKRNFAQGVSFRILGVHESPSPNRNASNGVFLYQRFTGASDQYVSGVRVDGQAVIKKKRHGRNFTLALVPFFVDGPAYDRNANPNRIPVDRAVRLRTETIDRSEGVQLRLFVDGNLVLDVLDDGGVGGEPIRTVGLAGVRSDFFDLELRGYTLDEDVS